MEGKCSNPDCTAPISCYEGHEDHTKCEHWLKNNPITPVSKEKIQKKINKVNPLWTGEPFKIEEVNLISYRNSPVVIGLAGKAKAGKTTFLAMLYTLLYNGEHFKKYSFSGSKTIIGWDKLYHKLKVVNKKVTLPDPTPSNYLRLLHLALRDSESKLKDILISDASGEVFSYWSQNINDSNAENARWIYDNSNGFVLFLDCEDLINRKNLAKTEIIDIAEMLKSNLKNRPIVVVWSKADLKADIHPVIKENLHSELSDIFSNYCEIDISNFPSKNPDDLVHKNNLEVIEWLLDKIYVPSADEIIIENSYPNDTFLNFKSHA
ncbi:MAG: hypothetical protein KUL78_07965 [Flavobacterium sp.]|nr:hypothetical protein [Flavobacterium sp.]